MVIIYDGKNLSALVARLEVKEVAILQSGVSPKPERAIVYMEKEMDLSSLSRFPPGWAIELESFQESVLESYPDRVFTRDFRWPVPLGEIYIQGSFKGLYSLCRYLLNNTRISFGVSGDVHRIEKLRELSRGRIGSYDGQPLHLILGQGQEESRQLYIWDGSLEELYRLRERFEELPRFHYLLQWGYLGRSFHSQRIIHGRYLGRISRRGFSFEWKRLLKVLAN